MIRALVTIVLLVAIALPNLSSAALTSENYSVSNDAIATDFIANTGTSASYRTRFSSGSIYVLSSAVSTPVATNPPQSTRTDRYLLDVHNTQQQATKNNSILVCHDLYGKRFAARVNTYVFINILKYGEETGNGGHEFHQFDIIPPFTYNFGDGEFSYEGKNWTVENIELHKNNCEGFLKQNSKTEPVNIPQVANGAREVVKESIPFEPVITPISFCEVESQYKMLTTAIDGQALLRVELPQGALRSDAFSSPPESVFFQIKPVPDSVFTSRVEQFASILENPNAFGEETTIRYVSPLPEFADTPQSKIDFDSDCAPSDSSEVQEAELPSDRVIKIPDTENWNKLKTGDFSLDNLALLTTPFSIGIVSDTGETTSVLNKSIKVNLFTSVPEDEIDSIYITKPSADNQHWFEVPFTIKAGEIIFDTNTTGEFYIWYVRTETDDEIVYDEIKEPWLLGFLDKLPLILLAIALFLLFTLFIFFAKKRAKKGTHKPESF